ncbi:MAG: hypothetical protein A2Y24_07645 [Clostridiales bacterium GWE2_32_10]|nr:MAG: hypothetical protein A2Y24_07645 [Clostridiales bacterium GWE2_32_10]HBY19749.1 hypothetical protein [Clostridiales bacterium]
MKLDFKKLNKKYVMIILAVVAVVLISGVAFWFASNQEDETFKGIRGNQKNDWNGQDRPNRGMMQDESSKSIYGKVTKIVGNQIAIAVAENPMQERINQANNTQDGSNNRESSERTSFREGGMGGFGGTGGFSRPGESSGSARTKTTVQDLKLTGETENVMIPVGLEINKMGMRSQSGTDGAQLSDITTDTIITVFVDKTDTAEYKTAKRVMIR